MKTYLTGIKPSGTTHLGNLVGAIRPALARAQDHYSFYFIADYHALTTVRDRKELQRLIDEVAATWLALGLDPNETAFYRQSAVPEVFELSWVLACMTPIGLLNRAHAYKAALDANPARGQERHTGINAGLFYYPVLMASDILAFDTDFVPVGADQQQHIEIARDIAEAFNRSYGPVLKLPEPLIADVPVLPGLDGRKMSKSYNNVIPLFAGEKLLRRSVARIVTDSRRPEEPKDPSRDTVFVLYSQFAKPDDVEDMRKRYLEGRISYGEAKAALADEIVQSLADVQARYEALMSDRTQIEAVLEAGASSARVVARRVLDRVREAVGVSGLAGPPLS